MLYRLAVFVFSISIPTTIFAQEECPSPIEFGFFNGVDNTLRQARKATQRFKLMVREIDPELNIGYQTFYNTTQGFFSDTNEVLKQRAAEVNVETSLDVMYWLVGGSRGLFINWIDAGNSQEDITLLYDTFVEAAISQENIFSNRPPTIEDMGTHRDQIDSIQNQQSPMLMVAHSQGNLFVNAAYNYALANPDYSSDDLKVLHIAPASTVLNGQHITANQDLVISALSVRESSNVPGWTIDLMDGWEDLDRSGHTLKETYTNPNMEIKSPREVGELNTRDLVKSRLGKLIEEITQNEQSNSCESTPTLIDFENPVVEINFNGNNRFSNSLSAEGITIYNAHTDGNLGANTRLPTQRNIPIGIISSTKIKSVSFKIAVGAPPENPIVPFYSVSVAGYTGTFSESNGLPDVSQAQLVSSELVSAGARAQFQTVPITIDFEGEGVDFILFGPAPDDFSRLLLIDDVTLFR